MCGRCFNHRPLINVDTHLLVLIDLIYESVVSSLCFVLPEALMIFFVTVLQHKGIHEWNFSATSVRGVRSVPAVFTCHVALLLQLSGVTPGSML